MDDPIWLSDRLEDLSDLVLHPALTLDRFADDAGAPVAGTDSPGAVLRARRRRGAVMLAAQSIIDECISNMDDIRLFGERTSERFQMPRHEYTFVWRYFPPGFRDAYDDSLFVDVMVVAGKVAYDLANPNSGPSACVAEQIILRAVGLSAEQLMAELCLGLPRSAWIDALLPDTSIIDSLYAEPIQAFEDANCVQNRALSVRCVRDWFVALDQNRIVHPYVVRAAHSQGMRVGGCPDGEPLPAASDQDRQHCRAEDA